MRHKYKHMTGSSSLFIPVLNTFREYILWHIGLFNVIQLVAVFYFMTAKVKRKNTLRYHILKKVQAISHILIHSWGLML